MSLPVAIGVIFVVLFVTLWGRYEAAKSGKLMVANEIMSFADCKAAGNLIMESYPEQCTTSDGKHFTNPDQSVVTDVVPHEYGISHLTVADGKYLVSLKNISSSPEGDLIVIEHEITTDKNDYCPKNDQDCWDHQEYGLAVHPVIPQLAGLAVKNDATVTLINSKDGATKPTTVLSWTEFLEALHSGKPNTHAYYGLVDEAFIMREEMVYRYSPYEVEIQSGLVTSLVQWYAE